MTQFLLFRSATVWLAIAGLAMLNGMIREHFLTPLLEPQIALALSGLILSVIIFVVTYFSFDFIGARTTAACFFIGIQWLLMTLMFELVAGYFVLGKTCSDLLQVFNLAAGDLFSLVLLVCLLSPMLVASLKGR